MLFTRSLFWRRFFLQHILIPMVSINHGLKCCMCGKVLNVNPVYLYSPLLSRDPLNPFEKQLFSLPIHKRHNSSLWQWVWSPFSMSLHYCVNYKPTGSSSLPKKFRSLQIATQYNLLHKGFFFYNEPLPYLLSIHT